MLAPITYACGRLPNGWPQPHFLHIDNDGGLLIEWIFGEQGAEDSWRVSFSWDPDDGAYVIVTTKGKQYLYGAGESEPATVCPALERWLTAPSLAGKEGG